MKAEVGPAATKSGFFGRIFSSYRKETRQSLAIWGIIALLNFAAQIILRRELQPGEFGTLNTTLGMIGVLTVPLLAVQQAFTLYLTQPHPAGDKTRNNDLRSAALLVTETFAWAWGGVAALLIFVLLPLLNLPRFSLELFVLMNVLVSLGSVVSWTVCRETKQLRFWTGLLLAATASRALAGAVLGWMEPWAEAGLAAFLLAGFILLIPALGARETDLALRWKTCQIAWDSDFLLYTGATFSVLLGVFLFTSADRIVSQSWFGTATNNNMGIVDWKSFDAYQTAGLLSRSLLWGTQPLLWILFARRTHLHRTTAASFKFFWIYLGALVVGAFLLGCLSHPLSQLFCGANFQSTAVFVPSLAAVMVLLGVLQGVAIFALASRRYPECFLVGVCGIGYAILLYFTGRQPQIMPAYMFGGGLVSLMVILFVGVVRWGRKQP